MRSNFCFIFEKRFEWIVWIAFILFRDSLSMSAARIFFIPEFFAVCARIPEPVPISKYEMFLVFLERYFFRKFAKNIESSCGLYIFCYVLLG